VHGLVVQPGNCYDTHTLPEMWTHCCRCMDKSLCNSQFSCSPIAWPEYFSWQSTTCLEFQTASMCVFLHIGFQKHCLIL